VIILVLLLKLSTQSGKLPFSVREAVCIVQLRIFLIVVASMAATLSGVTSQIDTVKIEIYEPHSSASEYPPYQCKCSF
jgi:hypothetical protein